MHKRSLWVDRRGAELRWPAPGNIEVGATGRGTLALWVRTQRPATYWGWDILWRVECNSTNWFGSYLGRASEVCRGGQYFRLPSNQVNYSNVAGWELHVHQWDFAAGWMRSWYNNAEPVGAAVTGAPAPEGTAAHLRLGYSVTTPLTWARDHLLVYSAGVWDELWSEAQMAAAWQRGYLEELQESHGAGNLTLLLRFHEGFEAQVAAGERTFSVAPGTAADRYCRMEEGLRELGVARYPLGRPRNDNSEDDRYPLNAICNLTHEIAAQREAVVDSNQTNYSTLTVTNFNNSNRAGAGYPWVPIPGTYRQLVHVPNEGNRPGYEMGLGPIAYKHYHGPADGVFDQFGCGRQFTVQSDAGNSPTSFKTDLAAKFATGYWTGARVQFQTGNCAGRALLVTGYDATTKVLTVEAALPATPSAGSRAQVSFHPRLLGQSAPQGTLMYEYSLPAMLWARHGDSKAFTELEWQASYNTGFARYQRGRTGVLPGSSYDGQGHGLGYGKWYGYTDPEPTELAIWLRKIEVAGPQRYQILRRDARRRGPALADNFMVRAADPYMGLGDSVKVWRKRNLSLVQDRPVKNASINQATADLCAAGTWRNTVWGLPRVVCEQPETGTVICAVHGRDPQGVIRLGYVQGQWNEATGRVAWTDEPAPAGKSNPVLRMDSLRTDRESDAPVLEPPWLSSIVQASDGSWSLFYGTRPDLVDNIEVYALHGAADRWSFDFATQFAGPVVPMFKGLDTTEPYGGSGFVPWANMHLYWSITENPWAQQTERRYVGYAGGKTIYNDGATYCADLRPVVGCAGADPKALAPLPWSNSLTPLPGPNMGAFHVAVLGQEDCVGILYNDGFTTGVGLLVSEDGVHFERLYRTTGTPAPLLGPSELPGEAGHLVPAAPFRLGNRRVYYYGTGEHANFGTIRWNGEIFYQLSSGQSQGWLETPILERPEEGWGELYLNADPAQGSVRVEVLDPAEGLPLAGRTAEDCDPLGEGLEEQVTWGGAGLAELTAKYLRLRIYLERPGAEAATPTLYGWAIAPAQVITPQVSGLLLDGEAAPAAVGNPQPVFSWSYSHPQGKAQAGCQVQVASTRELLAAGTPDMWDSGEVETSESSLAYAGAPLGERQTYFWRVRARTAEGVWSETW